MATQLDDFFTDLEALQNQSQSTPPQQNTQAIDFFSDLEQLQSRQAQPTQPQQQQDDFFTDLQLEAQAQQPIKTPYDVEELAPEQFKQLPISEQLEYLQDVKREREYRSARGFAKGAASGLTLGLSEKIPGLKPEEGEFMTGFGEFLGSALPISKLYNVLGKPLVSLAARSPIAAKGLQSLARMTGFGITGAAYETGKETIKTGEVPSAVEVAKYAGQWAAFDGALQILGKAASAFMPKLKSVAQSNNMSERQVLNDVMDGLKERKIDIEKDPEKAIKSAQEILDNYPRKMQGAREERITALKAKETETEKKILEPFTEKKEALTERQKETIEKRKKAIQLEEQAFEKKKQDLETKATEIESRGSEQLEKLVEKEDALKQKLEEQKSQDAEKLRKQSDKEIQTKTREIEKKKATYQREIEKQESRAKKDIEAIDRQIAKAKTQEAPTKFLENRKESIRAKADKTIEKLKSAIETQDNRLEAFKEKATANLESRIEKIEAKELHASDRQQLERNLSLIDRQIAKEQKLIYESEQLLAKEKDRRVSEVKQDAQARLKALEKRKGELEKAQAERLKVAREKAYAERHPMLKVTAGKKSVPSTFAQSVAEPVIEATGEGARARIEYPKEGMDKIVDKMNSFIEQAKTPAESLKRYSEAANVAIFNSLAPLEKLEAGIPVPEQVSTRIKLAKSAASEINSVLENGIFSNITGNFEHGGLKEAYGDLTWKRLTKDMKPHEFSLEDLDVYRTSKIALKRQKEGKITGIDTKEAMKDIARLKDKYEEVDKRIRAFQQATLSTYGKDLLGPDLIKQWNKEYYSPLYRVMDTGKDSVLSAGSLQPKQPFKKMEGSERKIIPPSESDPLNTAMLVRNARKNDAVLQYMKLVQEGKLPGKIKVGKPNPITEEAFKALGVDSEMKPLAEQLYQQTRLEAFTPEKNIIRGWKNGKPIDIEVPEEIYDVFASMNPQQRGPVTKFFGAVNRLFSRSISMEPRKFLSIASRDALSSLIYSRTGSNPVSVFEALSDVWNASPVYKEFLAMGGDVYASKLAERIDRAKTIDQLITPGKEGIIVPFEKMGSYFRKYGQALSDISLAVPLSEYKRALAKYGNTAEGRLMAAMEARRVVYDPTRKGASKVVQGFGNYIPFWNVSLQDMSMVGQNLKRPETWMKGMAAITAPTLLLKMANEGNPDYEALTPIDKAAFWHIYSGDKHIRIPIPWLLGTAFKAGAEVFYDTTTEMMNVGDDRAKDAWKGMYDHFIENVSGAVPPAMQIYLEQTTGKAAPSPVGYFLGTESRAPEVVPKRLQGLEPKHQYTAKTSVLAKKWGEFWNVSPVKVERFIKGLGATSAATALALTDEIAYFTGLAENKRPEQRESNYLMLGHFVRNSPESRTKYANEFYEYLREAEQRKRSQKMIKEKGLDESLEDLSFQRVPLGKYQRKISKLFRDMRSIEDDENMSSAAKKSNLDSYQREINDLYKEAVEEVRAAKAEE